MTPEQIALVQTSFARLGPRVPDLTARFYRELFERAPELRPLFPTDMADLQVQFATKLTEIVHSIPRLDEFIGHTRALGARHAGYGVRAADYETVGGALLGALAGVLGDDFDEPTHEAWIIAYNLIAEIMLEGAASVRLIGS